MTSDKCDDCFDVCCSGVSLQHSQSASPADIGVCNENLGLSVNTGHQPQTAEVPERLSSDHARNPERLPSDYMRHPHVPQPPEPPPAYEGSVSPRGRGRNPPAGMVVSENGSAGRLRSDEQRMMAENQATGTVVSARVYDADVRMPRSPNVSSQFTSDISLASSSVTTYEDNGRQKVCL